MVSRWNIVLGGLAVFAAALLTIASVRSHGATMELDQGWSPAQRQFFYYTPQGTAIMPASWLASIPAADGTPLMSRRHMRSLGFIYDNAASPSNPYRWPIGFAIQKVDGVAMVGLTCAACHTADLTYRGTVVRIDGGQANINLDQFKSEIADAILATGASSARRAAFERQAVALGYPRDRIGSDFEARYEEVRLGTQKRERWTASGTLAGPGRNDALAAIAIAVFSSDLGVPANTNRPTAPVNFPYLWSIGHFDWVQYNASVRQPMARNVGEALGVGAITNIINPKTGELQPLPQRWRTSIPVRNLYTIENTLATLEPPPWPQAAFGSIDPVKAAHGRQLFGTYCAACHAVRWVAHSAGDEWSMLVIPLTHIGTDPTHATNFAKDTYDATKLGLSKHTTAAVGLQAVTQQIRDQGYRDAHVPPSQWATYDGFGRKNILASPCGYKARPLVGVWATAPFLHNGSVPTVFDLLSDTRPSRFWVTTTEEFDPVHLGIADHKTPGAMLFDTSIVGNSNAGHWFTDDKRPGRIGPRLSDEKKFAIIEYLKSATYADYPRITVQHEDPLPCVTAQSYATW